MKCKCRKKKEKKLVFGSKTEKRNLKAIVDRQIHEQNGNDPSHTVLHNHKRMNYKFFFVLLAADSVLPNHHHHSIFALLIPRREKKLFIFLLLDFLFAMYHLISILVQTPNRFSSRKIATPNWKICCATLESIFPNEWVDIWCHLKITWYLFIDFSYFLYIFFLLDGTLKVWSI